MFKVISTEPPSFTSYWAAPKETTSSVSVEPLPEADHVPVPSSLLVRTCTSYSVLESRPVMGVDVATPV